MTKLYGTLRVSFSFCFCIRALLAGWSCKGPPREAPCPPHCQAYSAAISASRLNRVQKPVQRWCGFCEPLGTAGPKFSKGVPFLDPPASTTPGHFGAVFAIKDTKPLSQVLASSKEFKDPVQVSGQVDSVCQKKGCWLVVKDGEAQARILMKDHSFTVPMDSKGQKVVVEGTIEARTFNEAQVKHLEKDAGKDPAGVAGERTEYVLTATAIELKNT